MIVISHAQEQELARQAAVGAMLRAQRAGARTLSTHHTDDPAVAAMTSKGIVAHLNSEAGERLQQAQRRAAPPVAARVAHEFDPPSLVAHIQRNARGSNNDPRQQIADLISMDSSPFTPDDESALRSMSPATLQQMYDKYCGSGE